LRAALAERDERIAELEAEVARLSGNPRVTARRVGDQVVTKSDDGEYATHLERVVSSDPDPTRRLAAAGALERLLAGDVA
jgi:hypothetical protein